MSRYTSGWTWQDNATEEQMTAPGAEAQCRLYAEHIARLYREIPDDSANERFEQSLEQVYETAHEESESFDPRAAHYMANKVVEAVKLQHAAKVSLLWDQIEFFEQKLLERGARLRRPYEHHNEDEQRMEHAENPHE